LWVRVRAWELGDQLFVGEVLPSQAIRVTGTVEPFHAPVRERISQVDGPHVDPDAVEYVVTGSVVTATDYQSDTGSGPHHAGTDVVLSVNGDLMQSQIAGPASDIDIGSALTVRGRLSHIGDYEWDAFGLVDTRRAWAIEEVHRLPDDDLMLRLRPTASPA